METQDTPITINVDEQPYLGVPTGIRGSHHALKALTAMKNEPGYIVRGSVIEDWRFLGFTRLDGEVFLYGPYLEGRSLEEVLEMKPDHALPLLRRLVQALALLKERSVGLFSFESDSVLFLDDGGVFFLPRPIMEKISISGSEAHRIRTCESITHPYLENESRASFTVAVLLYRVLTGEFSFMDDTVEGIRDKIRNLDVVSPHLARPEVRKEVSRVIMSVFDKSGTYSLEDWERIITDWIEQGVFRDVTIAEREELLAKARERKDRTERAFKSKLFWEKNGRLVLIVTGIVIAAGFIVGGFVRNLLAPRVTAGFTPEQVVEAYYTSINSLDHMTMDDCVIRGAGRGQINEIIHLYVISKQTMAYEGQSYIVPADRWVENGRPELEPPMFVYGIADLRIRRERGEPEPVFTAEYEKWSRTAPEGDDEAGSATGEQAPAGPLYEGNRVRDRLFLTQRGEDWVIYRIERLETSPIDLEAVSGEPQPEG